VRLGIEYAILNGPPLSAGSTLMRPECRSSLPFQPLFVIMEAVLIDRYEDIENVVSEEQEKKL